MVSQQPLREAQVPTTTPTDFHKGQYVEVKIKASGVEPQARPWYKAKIVQLPWNSYSNFSLRSACRNTYLVKGCYLPPSGLEKFTKVRVGAFGIRPEPPKDDSPTFVLNQMVECLYQNGWYKGKIIRVSHFFCIVESSVSTSFKKETFVRHNLRVCREWIDGQWVSPEEVRKNVDPHSAKGVVEDIPIRRGRGRPPKMRIRSTSSSAIGSEHLEFLGCQNGIAFGVPSEEHRELVSEQRGFRDDCATHIKEASSIIYSASKESTLKTNSKREGEQREMFSPKRGKPGAPTNFSGYLTQGWYKLKALKPKLKEWSKSNICKIELKIQTLMEKVKGMDKMEEDGALSDTEVTEKASVAFKLEMIVNKIIWDDAAGGWLFRNIADEEEPSAISEETGFKTSFDLNKSIFILSDDVPVDKVLEREPGEINEVNLQSLVADPAQHKMLQEPTLPFVKKSDMWEIVESKDAFKWMPQKPHFHPLEQLNDHEILREVRALGYMEGFSLLVDKTMKFKLEDPISDFEETLNALSELDRHGFNTHKARARLENLMDIKYKVAAHEEKLTPKKSKVEEFNGEKVKNDAEIEKVTERIREKKAELESLLKKKRKIDMKTRKMLKEVNKVEEEKVQNHYGFYEVQSSPCYLKFFLLETVIRLGINFFWSSWCISASGLGIPNQANFTQYECYSRFCSAYWSLEDGSLDSVFDALRKGDKLGRAGHDQGTGHSVVESMQGNTGTGQGMPAGGTGMPLPHIKSTGLGHDSKEREGSGIPDCDTGSPRAPCDTDSMFIEEKGCRIKENTIFGEDSQISSGSVTGLECTGLRPEKKITIDPLSH
ncbi:hypothetical protein GIB67_022669 [Kingdonia uniflora]|uniref:Uncharacterized protein n=1 Tax=Kingdonia uniflora TaxID=39325 RepID=A0A7J7P8B5_9MAGN|nr:hypothetical protein GIB67_022669 [Kingdonia uniflora]